jgi:hypothetical protein
VLNEQLVVSHTDVTVTDRKVLGNDTVEQGVHILSTDDGDGLDHQPKVIGRGVELGGVVDGDRHIREVILMHFGGTVLGLEQACLLVVRHVVEQVRNMGLDGKRLHVCGILYRRVMKNPHQRLVRENVGSGFVGVCLFRTIL